MIGNATTARTGAAPTPGRIVVRGLVVATVVAGLAWSTAAPVVAGLGDPVDPRPSTEPETTTTEAAATTGGDGPTTTGAGDGTDQADRATVDETDGGGTSLAALGAVGVVAFILGLLVAAVPLGVALSRRKGSAPPPQPSTAPPPGPAAGAGPAIGPAPSRDTDQLRQQRVVLAEGLIALRDHLPSAALGQEAAQTLAAAGITEVAPVAQPFDASQHRAVHQVATDDPARHGMIASVERPGYRDGSTVLRQPEVVVAVHGGSS